MRRRSSSRSSTAVTSRPSSNRAATSSSCCAIGPSVKDGIISVPMDPLTLPLDYAAIEKILPHRYPFLLVDRITEFEPDKRIVGVKNVSLNERNLAHPPE